MQFVPLTSKMECGECTVCCDLFPVKWLEKPANTPCQHCDKGCLIHSTKPAECSDFECAYAQMDGVDIRFRPDNCKIVFEKLNERIFFGTCIDVTSAGQGQVLAFLKQGFSVVLVSPTKDDTKFIVNDQHNEPEIRKEFYDLKERSWQHMQLI